MVIERNKETPRTNNLLLLFVLQCRADDFIQRFEEQNNRCFMGVYSIYQVAYCNYLILSDEEWNPAFMTVVKSCRMECKKILDYLKTVISIPDTFEAELAVFLKKFSYYEDDEDLDMMLDGSLHELVSLGYREIDCKLYEAGMKLKYSEVKELLRKGANPRINISGDYTASEAENIKCEDFSCLTTDVHTVICDTVDLDGIYSYWEKGINREEQTFIAEDLRSFFQAAAYQIMKILISNNTSQTFDTWIKTN